MYHSGDIRVGMMLDAETETLLAPTNDQDQFSVISTALSAHIGLVHDTSTFLSERAMLEREYANKLRALTHKYRTQRDKRVMECTVGPDPSKQWSPEVVNRR